MSARMPDTAKSGPTGSCALRMDRLCPAGWEEAAGFTRCLLSTQPTDHSISLGTFPFPRKKMGNAGQRQRHSKLTFGMLPANHPQVPEFKKTQCLCVYNNFFLCFSQCALCQRDLCRFCILVTLNCFSLTINTGMCRHNFIFTSYGC